MKIVLTLLCFCFVSLSSLAQECSEDFKKVEGLWQKLTLENALNDPESISSDFDALKGSLTKSLGGLSLKSNAPKFLPTSGKAKKATLKPRKKRTYVTYMAPRETMQIDLEGLTGLNGLEVIICAHTKSNMTENLEQFTFTTTDTSKKFILEGVKGKVLSISLKNKGEKMQFTIAAN